MNEYLYWLSNLAHTERQLALACDEPTRRMYRRELKRVLKALARWEREEVRAA